jgi:transcriptional regulator with XRE-family HTH domain
MDPERYLTDRERLATRLRDLRQNAGLTGIEAARRARMSQPKISKLENGRLLRSVEDVQTLLDLYQAGSAERDALLEVAGRLHSAIVSNRTILRRGAARRQARLGELRLSIHG